MKIGIIGSTGVQIGLLTTEYEIQTKKMNGKIFNYYKGIRSGHEIYFVTRNNFDGPVPPHLVDYPGIMRLFKELKADFVLASAIVGSLSYDYHIGDYVVLDQFIDMTKNNCHTVYDNKAFAFVDFTAPYCPKVREALINSCRNINVSFHASGCYVGVDGPRYETAAEVKMYGMLGGHVVGMTNVTEAIMARELGICYGAVALISNYGAGMDTDEILRQDCYSKTMECKDSTIAIICNLIDTIQEYETCSCRTKNSDMLFTNL